MGAKQSKQPYQQQKQQPPPPFEEPSQPAESADTKYAYPKLNQAKFLLLSDRADANLLSIIFTCLGRLDFLHASVCCHAMHRIGQLKQSRSHQQRETEEAMSMSEQETGENRCTSVYSRIIEDLFSDTLPGQTQFLTPSTVDLRIDETIQANKRMESLTMNPLFKHITSVHFVATQAHRKHPVIPDGIIYYPFDSKRMNTIIPKLKDFVNLRTLYIDLKERSDHSSDELVAALMEIAPKLHVLRIMYADHYESEPDLTRLLPQLTQLRVLSLAIPPQGRQLLHLIHLEALILQHHFFWSDSDSVLQFLDDIRALTLKHRLRSLSCHRLEPSILNRLVLNAHVPEYEAFSMQLRNTDLEESVIEEYEARYPIEPLNLTRLVVGMRSVIALRAIRRMPTLTSIEHTNLHESPLILTPHLHQGLRDLRVAVRESSRMQKEFDLPDLPSLQVLHLTIANELSSYRMSKVDMTRIFSHIPTLTELHLSVFPLTFVPLVQCCPLIRTMKLTVHEPLSDGQRDDDLFSTLSQLTHFTTLELRFTKKYRMIMAAAAVVAAKKLNPTGYKLESDYTILPFLLPPSFHHAFLSSSSWRVLRLSVEQFSRNDYLDNENQQPPQWRPSESVANVPTWNEMMEKQPNAERLKSQLQRFRVYYHRTEAENDCHSYGLVPLVKLNPIGSAKSTLEDVSSSPTPPTSLPNSMLLAESNSLDSQRYGWRQHLLLV